MISFFRLTSKTTIFSLILVLFTLLSTTHIANAAENVTAVLDVPGMTCKFCPITIRKALEKVPGVVEVKATFDTKTATVTFDPAKTNIETLIKTTTNAGYPSTLKK
jgi:mercuric ion binding protein